MSSFPFVVRTNMVFSAVRAARAVESCACILLLLLSPASALATNWQAEQLFSIRFGATTPQPQTHLLFDIYYSLRLPNKHQNQLPASKSSFLNIETSCTKPWKTRNFSHKSTIVQAAGTTSISSSSSSCSCKSTFLNTQYWNKFHKTQNPKISHETQKRKILQAEATTPNLFINKKY